MFYYNYGFNLEITTDFIIEYMHIFCKTFPDYEYSELNK